MLQVEHILESEDVLEGGKETECLNQAKEEAQYVVHHRKVGSINDIGKDCAETLHHQIAGNEDEEISGEGSNPCRECQLVLENGAERMCIHQGKKEAQDETEFGRDLIQKAFYGSPDSTYHEYYEKNVVKCRKILHILLFCVKLF